MFPGKVVVSLTQSFFSRFGSGARRESARSFGPVAAIAASRDVLPARKRFCVSWFGGVTVGVKVGIGLSLNNF